MVGDLSMTSSRTRLAAFRPCARLYDQPQSEFELANRPVPSSPTNARDQFAWPGQACEARDFDEKAPLEKFEQNDGLALLIRKAMTSKVHEGSVPSHSGLRVKELPFRPKRRQAVVVENEPLVINESDGLKCDRSAQSS